MVINIIIKIIIWIFSIGLGILFYPNNSKADVDFLKIEVSGRVVGMGEAFCGVANDINSIKWNPAGLNQISRNEFTATHISWFQDVNYEYLAYAQPVTNITFFGIKDWEIFKKYKKPGVMAISLGMLSVDKIKEYNIAGNYKGTFDANDMAFTVSYSKPLRNDLSAGANLKYITYSIKNKNASSIAFDIGALYKPLNKKLTYGVSLQNIGQAIGIGESKDPFPLNLRFGAGYKMLNNALTLALDVNMPKAGDTKFYLGAEYSYQIYQDTNLFLRSGYKQGVDLGKITGGFGINWNEIKFDYAFVSYNDLGNTHQMSLLMSFGKDTEKGTNTEKGTSTETKKLHSTPNKQEQKILPSAPIKREIEFEEQETAPQNIEQVSHQSEEEKPSQEPEKIEQSPQLPEKEKVEQKEINQDVSPTLLPPAGFGPIEAPMAE